MPSEIMRVSKGDLPTTMEGGPSGPGNNGPGHGGPEHGRPEYGGPEHSCPEHSRPEHGSPVLLARLYEDPSGRDIPPRCQGHGQLVGCFRGLIFVGTSRKQWLVASTGAVWIPPHHVHSLRSQGAFSGYVVYVADCACETLSKQPCTIAASALLREAVRRAAAWDSSRAETEAAHIATVILDEIRALPRQPFGLPMPSDRRMLRITSALVENPADNRGLQEWAARAGMSTRTMIRRFTTETGFSFTEWRQRARLMRALELLAVDTPVTTVALDLGYETVSAFIAMFRRAFGVTPTRYFEETRDSSAAIRLQRESVQLCKSETRSKVSPERAVSRWIRRSPKIVAGVQKPPGVAALSTSSVRQAAAWPSILPVEP
jgi:AraC-like DNA-binding protein